jgi:hypothetical protein
MRSTSLICAQSNAGEDDWPPFDSNRKKNRIMNIVDMVPRDSSLTLSDVQGFPDKSSVSYAVAEGASMLAG